MRLAIILTILITTVLAAGVGWAASLSVDSDHITMIQVDQTAVVPTPTPTPVPIPMTLYLDASTTPSQLLDHQPSAQTSVNVPILPATHYFKSTPGTVGSVSNTENWKLVLVVNGALGLTLNIGVTIYWQDVGPNCITPTSEQQIVAEGSSLLQLSLFASNRGEQITIPAGNVSHTFDSDDILCLRLNTTASLLGVYKTGVTSTSGPVQGVMSNLTGPVYAP